MHITQAQFERGIIGTNDILLDNTPHFAFVGRSNVGKSSVINSLVGSKTLVKSSSKPGKTQEINFFRINNDIFFVDLPGYGYAKLGFKRREKLRKLILWYLTSGEAKPEVIFLIIDLQVGCKEFDLEMLEILQNQAPYEASVVIIANKSDKLNQSERVRTMEKVRDQVPGYTIIEYSSKTGRGRGKVFREIETKLDMSNNEPQEVS